MAKNSSVIEKVLHEEALSEKILTLLRKTRKVNITERKMELKLLFFAFLSKNKKVIKNKGKRSNEYKTTSSIYEQFKQAEDRLSE